MINAFSISKLHFEGKTIYFYNKCVLLCFPKEHNAVFFVLYIQKSIRGVYHLMLTLQYIDNSVLTEIKCISADFIIYNMNKHSRSQ